MREVVRAHAAAEFVERVRRAVGGRTRRAARLASCMAQAGLLLPGKMLRTRLAARFVARGVVGAPISTLEAVCASTEMAHTASLCHDDVIDGALLRRAGPTLWRATSPSAAVLIGDLLLCEGMDLLLGTEGGRHAAAFVSKIREVCVAETEQELAVRGRRLSVRACLDIARRKTGPLFAFVAGACAGEDESLRSALEEAGYRVGAAYQVADDWVDAASDESVAGKTLGTDARRGKFTLAEVSGRDGVDVGGEIARLCSSALEHLRSWPCARAALGEYLRLDVQPALDRCFAGSADSVRFAV